MADAVVSVQIRDPLGSAGGSRLPLQIDHVTATVSTKIDCGYETAEVRFSGLHGAGGLLPILAGRSDLVPLGHTVISRNGTPVWEGMLTGIMVNGTTPVGITATGYGLATRGRTWSSTANLGVLDALGQAIGACAPWMALDPELVDPGVTLGADQLTDITPADLVRAVNTLAAADGVPLRCQVWDGPRLTIQRRTPTAPAIVVDADDPGLAIDELDLAAIANRVIVSNGTTRVSVPPADQPVDPTVLAVEQQLLITVDAGTQTDAMLAIGRAALAEHGNVRVGASLRSDDGMLHGPTGAAVPAWGVRAGDWALVAGVGPLEITATRLELPSGVWSADLGAPPAGARWESWVTGAVARAYRAISPVTWLRG